jgi:hypothetical protein
MVSAHGSTFSSGECTYDNFWNRRTAAAIRVAPESELPQMSLARLSKYADDLTTCGCWRGSKSRPYHCALRYLCTRCGGVWAKASSEGIANRVMAAWDDEPSASVWCCTLTVPQSDDLEGRYRLLTSSFKEAIKAKPIAGQVLGATRVVEPAAAKRGAGWYPHIHAILVVDNKEFDWLCFQRAWIDIAWRGQHLWRRKAAFMRQDVKPLWAYLGGANPGYAEIRSDVLHYALYSLKGPGNLASLRRLQMQTDIKRSIQHYGVLRGITKERLAQQQHRWVPGAASHCYTVTKENHEARVAEMRSLEVGGSAERLLKMHAASQLLN